MLNLEIDLDGTERSSKPCGRVSSGPTVELKHKLFSVGRKVFQGMSGFNEHQLQLIRQRLIANAEPTLKKFADSPFG